MGNCISTTARTAALVACIVSLAGAPARVLGIVVDSFQTPQESDSPERRVSAPEALGRTRFLTVQRGASASVSGGSLVFEQTLLPGYFSVAYDRNGLGLGPIDVTYGNSMDSLQVTATSRSLPGHFFMRLSSDLFGFYASELNLPVQPGSSPTVCTFPLSQFFTARGARGPATLTSIQSITLRFESDASSGSGQIVLSSILIAPEPATVLLLVLGGLAVMRRR